MTLVKGKTMTKVQEIKIINNAVNRSVKGNNRITRRDAAEKAAILANKKGVNVQSAPYLQDIFYDALDKKEEEYFSSEIVKEE